MCSHCGLSRGPKAQKLNTWTGSSYCSRPCLAIHWETETADQANFSPPISSEIKNKVFNPSFTLTRSTGVQRRGNDWNGNGAHSSPSKTARNPLPSRRSGRHCCHGNTGYRAEQVRLYCISGLRLCHHPGLSALKCFSFYCVRGFVAAGRFTWQPRQHRGIGHTRDEQLFLRTIQLYNSSAITERVPAMTTAR